MINKEIVNTDALNRTLTVGRSFCGKTYLLFSKFYLFRSKDTLKRIYIITRSPEHSENLEYSISEHIEILETYRNKRVVFDDMLDTSQKLIVGASQLQDQKLKFERD